MIGIALGLIGNLLACKGYNTGWWLAVVRMLHFMPFYSLGIFYNRTLEKYERKLPGILYFAVIMGIKLALTYHYGKFLVYTPSWCNDFTEGPLMPIIVGYLGIAMWMRIATVLEPVFGKNKYVNLLADNTYSIMMNQFLGFMIVKTIYGVAQNYSLCLQILILSVTKIICGGIIRRRESDIPEFSICWQQLFFPYVYNMLSIL